MNFQREKIPRKKIVFSFLLAFVILYLIISNISVDLLLSYLKNVNLVLYVSGFVAFYLSVFVRGVRWKYLLDRVNIPLTLWTNLKVYFLSWFFNCIFPAKMGDIYRGYYVKSHFSKIIGRIFLERVVDVSTLIFLVVLTSFLYLKKIPHILSRPMEIGILLSIAAILAIIAIRRVSLSRRFFVAFKEGASINRREIPVILALSFLIWILESARLFFVADATGIELSFGVAIFIALAASLLTAFPTPAGLGAVEFGIAGLLILFGIEKEVAISIALLDRLISYWSILVFGGILYAFKGK
jgi:hypothetical protein